MEIFEETSTFLDGSARMFSKKGIETWKNLRNINIFRWFFKNVFKEGHETWKN